MRCSECAGRSVSPRVDNGNRSGSNTNIICFIIASKTLPIRCTWDSNVTILIDVFSMKLHAAVLFAPVLVTPIFQFGAIETKIIWQKWVNWANKQNGFQVNTSYRVIEAQQRTYAAYAERRERKPFGFEDKTESAASSAAHWIRYKFTDTEYPLAAHRTSLLGGSSAEMTFSPPKKLIVHEFKRHILCLEYFHLILQWKCYRARHDHADIYLIFLFVVFFSGRN